MTLDDLSGLFQSTFVYGARQKKTNEDIHTMSSKM